MVLFYVLIVCTVTLPPGVKPIAVDKYIYLSIYSRTFTVVDPFLGHVSGVSIFINFTGLKVLSFLSFFFFFAVPCGCRLRCVNFGRMCDIDIHTAKTARYPPHSDYLDYKLQSTYSKHSHNTVI